MKDFFIMAAFVLIVLGARLVLFNSYVDWQCSNYQEITGNETKYIDFDACYVKQGADWVRYDDTLRNNVSKGE